VVDGNTVFYTIKCKHNELHFMKKKYAVYNFSIIKNVTVYLTTILISKYETGSGAVEYWSHVGCYAVADDKSQQPRKSEHSTLILLLLFTLEYQGLERRLIIGIIINFKHVTHFVITLYYPTHDGDKIVYNIL
jgi:hypothetical protein